MDIEGTNPVSLVMSALALFVSTVGIIVSIAGVIVSYIVAKKYGDLAAVEASRKLHEEDARRARLVALRSLLNEVERIRKVAEHNSGLAPPQVAEPVTRVPTTAFETAFVSGTSNIDGSPELLEAVTDYLACADSVNSLVDIYVAGTTSAGGAGAHRVTESARKIVEYCENNLLEILDRLKTFLQRELEEA
jgi:hypothetical protein